MLRAFGKRQQIERGRRGPQFLHANGDQARRRPEALDERIGVDGEHLSEDTPRPPARGGGGRGRLGGRLGVGRGGGLAQGGDAAHCRLPASSKIGIYIRMTMAPTTRPMAAMSSGSNSRIAQSIQRVISSSWKAAMRSIISPIPPLCSPTASMRSATGVVSPLASPAPPPRPPPPIAPP